MRTALLAQGHTNRGELQRQRLDHERDMMRNKAGAEARHEQAEISANKEFTSLEQEANQALDEAQARTGELEALLADQTERSRVELEEQKQLACVELEEAKDEAQRNLDEIQQEARRTLEEQEEHASREQLLSLEKMSKMRRQNDDNAEMLRQSQEETDLKRETATALKSEVIDNDRLTVANLNRIKNLEAQLEEEREQVDTLVRDNEQLRSNEDKFEALQELLTEREGMCEELKELLQGREAMVEDLTQRLKTNTPTPSRLDRRDSFMDRFGLASKSPFADGLKDRLSVLGERNSMLDRDVLSPPSSMY